MTAKNKYRVGDEVVVTRADGSVQTGTIKRIEKSGELALQLGPRVTVKEARRE